jgi:sterol desaturase/sphingolipid hydroxylase (fatty acid hydroxylase superfamily)
MKGLLLIVGIPPIIAFLLWLEKTNPIEKDQPRSEIICNYKMVAINVIVNQLLKPAASLCAASLVNAMGGGFFELRTDGWWLVPSLIVFILAMELYSYSIHRLQHAVPALWAMHSLHHSAESLTLVVGARHYWFEGVAMVAFLPLLDVVFKIPSDLLLVGALLYFLPDQCAHVNIRFSLGRFALWINNPQYHRIHHSIRPEHRDKNFCKLLPIIDVIFGTAWKPAADEFPPTGLVPSKKPATLIDGFLWPFRGPRSVAARGAPADFYEIAAKESLEFLDVMGNLAKPNSTGIGR